MTILFLILTGLAVLFAAGYRSRITDFAGSEDLDLPEDLETYLQKTEAEIPGLVPGTEKGIQWAGATGKRTEYAIVNLHGFSASRRELSPVVENLGKALGANVYFGRLTAHGEGDPEAYAKLRADDWVRDTQEAVEIGKRIGDKLIIVGTSTGATLATWWYTRHPDAIAGMVFVSPNFGTKNRAGQLFLLPWGRMLARLAIGKYMAWDSESEDAATYWSNRFRAESLAELSACVHAALTSDLARVSCPLLVLYTDNDETLNTDQIRSTFDRFGSETKEIRRLDEATRHILAGDIQSPQMTAAVTEMMTEFVRSKIMED